MLRFILMLIFSYVICTPILDAQKDAINEIAFKKGYTQEELNQIISQYKVPTVAQLTQLQAAEVINKLQNLSKEINLKKDDSNSYKTVVFNEKPVLADVLEVGMSKYFYLIDGNRVLGTIIEINDNLCSIKTKEGILSIPMSDILEETIDLVKTDDTRYKGPLIKEDNESLLVRSRYGDVLILKKEVHSMQRYHGGKLSPQIESRKTFEQGEDALVAVFFDPNAFVLEPNTFYLSAMSIGYGLTDRFMMTTQFGSSLSNDLNLHPKLRLMHQKTSNKETALSIGIGIHRNYKIRKSLSKFSHKIYLTENGDNFDKKNTLNLEDIKGEPDCGNNESSCLDLKNFFDMEETNFYWESYIVYSSKRKNPTGRGKVGYSVGLKTSNISQHIADKYEYIANGDTLSLVGKEVPWHYRFYATFEYDLQKRLKFVASMYADNSNRSLPFEDAIGDYLGDIGNAFSFDALGGEPAGVDFDFGFTYSVNENLRIGLHFQQPYFDIHWEFFEF